VRIEPIALIYLGLGLSLTACSTGDESSAGDESDDDGDDDDASAELGGLVWEVDLDQPTSVGLIPAWEFLFVVSDEGDVSGLFADSGDAWWTNTIAPSGPLSWVTYGDGNVEASASLALTDGDGLSLFQVYGEEEFRGYVPLDSQGEWSHTALEQGASDALNFAIVGADWGGYTLSCVTGASACATFQIEDVVTVAPAAVGRDLLLVTTAELHRVLEASDVEYFSDTAWSVSLPFEPAHGPLVHDDYVVLSSADGELLVLDSASGDEVWSYDMGTKMDGPVSIEPSEGLVLAAGNDGVVYALTIRGGAERWTYAARDAVFGGVLVEGDQVAVASADGTVVVLDLDSGEPLWTYDTETELIARPLQFGDTVVVLGDQGQVFALEGP